MKKSTAVKKENPQWIDKDCLDQDLDLHPFKETILLKKYLQESVKSIYLLLPYKEEMMENLEL